MENYDSFLFKSRFGENQLEIHRVSDGVSTVVSKSPHRTDFGMARVQKRQDFWTCSSIFVRRLPALSGRSRSLRDGLLPLQYRV